MLPKWVKSPCEKCELLAYDDGEMLAYFRLHDSVYSISYAYLHLCDEDVHSQLIVVVERFGKRVAHASLPKGKCTEPARTGAERIALRVEGSS